MIALLRKLRRRSAADVSMLAVALGVRLCALVLLRVVSFGRLQAWGLLAARMSPRRSDGGATTERAVAWAVATAAALLPVADSCLADALAAHWLLAACGCRSTIRFGVRRGASPPLHAHAWVESNGVVIVGAAPPYAFTPLE